VALPVSYIIDHAERILGIPPYKAAGGLDARMGEQLEVEEARAIIEAWLGEDLPDLPLPSVDTSTGFLRPAVASVAALPSSGNRVADLRIVTDSMSLYGWDGDSWELVGTGDGTGGGGGTGGAVSASGLTNAQLISEALENDTRVIDQIPVTFYGAPGAGSYFLWSDGSIGRWTPLPGGVYTRNFVDHVDAFTVTYRHVVPTPTDRAAWVPRNASSFTPASDAAAAALVTRVPEVRSENVARNAYVPSDAELAAFHTAVNAAAAQNPYLALVTGRPGITSPSTDDLIQWCSHKWGIPTNWVRAQMALESGWSMDFLGDLTVQPDQTHYDAAPAYARSTGLAVYESLGISQLRWYPDKSGNPNPHPGTDPLRWKSTAFNLDVYGATVRAFYDDPGGWRTAWGDGSYSPTEANHEWLSIGGWYQPYPWGNSGQMSYITSVQARLEPNVVPWRIANWTNIAADVALVRQGAWTRSASGAILTRPEPTIEAYVPPAAPGAPTGLTITPGDARLTLNWTAPASDGGSQLLGYRITEANEGWSVDTNGTNVMPYALTGLTNGHAQTFVVRAYNGVGLGPPTAAVTATPRAPAAPAAPTGVAGTPSDAQVILTWTAPTDNGGAAITNYVVTPYIGGVAQTPTVTSNPAAGVIVTGLVNGTAYTFRVAAQNSIGVGTASTASAAITPTAPPVPAAMPIISRGLPASSPTQPGGTASQWLPDKAVDGARGTRFSTINVPSSGSPQRLIIDLRTLTAAQRSKVVVCINNLSEPGTVNVGSTPVWYSAPKVGSIKTHAAATGPPAGGDAGWATIDTYDSENTTNIVRTNAGDAGFDLSAANWLGHRRVDAERHDDAGGARLDTALKVPLRHGAARHERRERLGRRFERRGRARVESARDVEGELPDPDRHDPGDGENPDPHAHELPDVAELQRRELHAHKPGH
jgi:hypothetical protein